MEAGIPNGLTFSSVFSVGNSAQTGVEEVLEYLDEPLVSCDIIGNTHSSVYDSGLTKILGGNMVKIIAWYDNEYGYSNRLADLVEKVANP